FRSVAKGAQPEGPHSSLPGETHDKVPETMPVRSCRSYADDGGECLRSGEGQSCLMDTPIFSIGGGSIARPNRAIRYCRFRAWCCSGTEGRGSGPFFGKLLQARLSDSRRESPRSHSWAKRGERASPGIHLS